MTNVEKRLSENHITLPDCPVPVACYIPAQTAGNFVFASGQAATVDGKLLYLSLIHIWDDHRRRRAGGSPACDGPRRG